jgi:hypothetical protein
VLQTKLLFLRQDHTEPSRHFVARLVTATCTTDVDFSDCIVKMVLLNGLEEEDIKMDILGTDNLDTKVKILTPSSV